MTIKLGEPRGDLSIINFGPLLRSDKAGRYELFRVIVTRAPDGSVDLRQCEMVGYMKGSIPKKGRLRLTLPLGERFLLIAQGNEKAGQVNTSQESLIAPFFLTVDAPPSNVKEVKAVAKRARLSKKNPISRVVHGILTKLH